MLQRFSLHLNEFCKWGILEYCRNGRGDKYGPIWSDFINHKSIFSRPIFQYRYQKQNSWKNWEKSFHWCGPWCKIFIINDVKVEIHKGLKSWSLLVVYFDQLSGAAHTQKLVKIHYIWLNWLPYSGVILMGHYGGAI